MSRLLLLLLAAVPVHCGQVWTVRLEEPTGLYRRTDEVVQTPIDKLGGNREGFRVVDSQGRELPWQVAGKALLFPASVIPGERPEYRVSCCTPGPRPKFRNEIVLRRLGMGRVELGNSRFRVVIDIGVPAIVEAYNLSAGPQRVLNLVETTPEDPGALREDIHSAEAQRLEPSPLEGPNTGWTSLGAGGEMAEVELLDTGPLLGRLRLSRPGETWELLWMAGSKALRWKVPRGFRFAAVSASPYLPFDRFVGGSEYEWPQGPEPGEPPDHDVGLRPWGKLPGGHAVYYRNEGNYGALGIIALDDDLNWKGVGSRRFEAVKPEGDAEVAITFPDWRGSNTVLEARKENRLLRQPLLVSVSGPEESEVGPKEAALREPEYTVETGAPHIRPFQPDALPLDGEWDLAYGEKGQGPSSEWRIVPVPGTVHTQWLPRSKWYTHDAEWLSGKEWWYRKKFTPPPRYQGKRIRLEFEATDYYADAWLNGSFLGRHEGYIDPYEYDVSSIIKSGAENELLVRVWTPVTYYWRHRPYTVKGSYGAVDQKPDDITPAGITRSVRLVASGAAILRDVAVATRLLDKGAEVEVEVESDGAEEGTSVELRLWPRNFSSAESYRIRAALGSGREQFIFHLDNPRLWWTWDHGKPNLYNLDIRILGPSGRVSDARNLAVGVREIEKKGWVFYLNRKRMFTRGTNYYYNLFLSEMDRAAYDRDLSLMLGMNANMIRLHCHFTNPEFYDLADEKGVLIWQDYLEAWYPHDTAFSLRAAALYDNHIRYVRNHPSVALWVTSDEEDLDNYADLTKHLAPRASLMDPQRRPVVRSTGRYGDAHVYHGWYGGSIWEYTKMEEAFVSELGATALPNYESLVRFLPNAWPIQDHAADWVFHKLQIPEAMRAWGDPGGMSLKDYVPRTQAYAARLFQIALERMRRRKYEAGGILHFHAIDIWPSVTMASIDFYRTPTKVFETVRRSFAPVLASLEYDRDEWRAGETFRCGVWAINDDWRAIPNAEIRWRIEDASQQPRKSASFHTSLGEDSAQRLGDAVWDAGNPGVYRLRAEVRDAEGKLLSENLFEFTVKP